VWDALHVVCTGCVACVYINCIYSVCLVMVIQLNGSVVSSVGSLNNVKLCIVSIDIAFFQLEDFS